MPSSPIKMMKSPRRAPAMPKQKPGVSSAAAAMADRQTNGQTRYSSEALSGTTGTLASSLRNSR